MAAVEQGGGPERALAAGSLPRAHLLALWLGAFALRAIFVVQAWPHPAVRIPVIDAEAYRDRALEILDGDLLGSAVYYLDPLYPFFLAAIYTVVPPDTIGVLLAQAALDAGSVVLIALIAARIGGARAGLVAGALAAGYELFFYYDVLLLKAPLMIFLMTTALFFVTRAAARDTLAGWWPAGFFLGLAALTRGNSLLFVPVLGLWLLACGRGDLKRRILAGVFLGLGLLCAIGPVTARNTLVGGDFVVLNSQGGQNFYIGHFEGNDTGAYQAPPFLRPNPVFEESDFAAEARRRSGRDMTPSEISAFWLREGLREIAADPGRFLKHSVRKVLVLANAYEIPDNASYAWFQKEVGGLLRLPFPTFAFVLPLAVLGAIRRGRDPTVALLLLFVASYSAGIVLFFNLSRLRLPIVPALIVLAALGGLELWRVARTREPRSIGVAAAVVVATFAVTQLPLLDQSLGVRYVNMGTGYLERSEAAWFRARERAEAGDEAGAAALVAASLGHRDEAEAQFRAALAETPGYPRALRALRRSMVTRAVMLLDLGRLDDALETAEAVTLRHPQFAGGFVLRGRVHQRRGVLDAARADFRRALELNPAHPAARAALAELDAEATSVD